MKIFRLALITTLALFLWSGCASNSDMDRIENKRPQTAQAIEPDIIFADGDEALAQVKEAFCGGASEIALLQLTSFLGKPDAQRLAENSGNGLDALLTLNGQPRRESVRHHVTWHKQNWEARAITSDNLVEYFMIYSQRNQLTFLKSLDSLGIHGFKPTETTLDSVRQKLGPGQLNALILDPLQVVSAQKLGNFIPELKDELAKSLCLQHHTWFLEDHNRKITLAFQDGRLVSSVLQLMYQSTKNED